MSDFPSLKYFKLFPDVPDPKKYTEKSACFDLSVYLKGRNHVDCYTASGNLFEKKISVYEQHPPFIDLRPFERIMLPTGLIFDIPEGYVLKLYPRSGTAYKKALSLVNGTGIIDEDYVEPVYLLVINLGENTIRITHGDRICQAELVPVLKYSLEEIQEKPERKTDRNGGFGSTGQ